MNDESPDPLDLMLRYAGGDATEAECRDLEKRLNEDAQARAMFCDLALEAMVIAEQTAATPLGGDLPGAAVRLRRGAWQRGWLALAAAVALMAGGMWLVSSERGDPEVVRVAAVHGPVRWTGAAGRTLDPRQGGRLRGGTIELLADNAEAQLIFDDGSQITLFGMSTATFSAVQQKQVLLRVGSLSASIAKQHAGRPFLLRTPTATLEVLGTRFTVDSSQEETLLSVDEGSVRLTRLADGRVVDVPAEHSVLARIDSADNLQAVLPGDPDLSWRSDLAAGPRGTLGEWLPADAENPARLRAEPQLIKLSSRDPVTIHRVSLQIPLQRPDTLQLKPDSRVRVRGRMTTLAPVEIMLSTKRLQGGFAGNYFVRPTPSSDHWQLDLPISEFRKAGSDSATTPDGLQLRRVVIYTIGTDAGLEIEQVEVLHSSILPK